MKAIVALAAVLAMAGCASNKEMTNLEIKEKLDKKKAEQAEIVLDNTPDWYLNPPKGDYGIFGVGTAFSQDLQFAIDKASLQAKMAIAETYNQQVSGIRKSYKAEGHTGTGTVRGQDSQTIDLFVDKADLSGAEIKERKIIQRGTGFQAYVLAFYPHGETNFVKQERLDAEESKAAAANAEKAHAELMDRIGTPRQ